MNDTIRPRRLFVSGGSRLSANAALLWRELGSLLAIEDALVVITGGLASRPDDPTARTADRTIIDGMLPTLQHRGAASEEHIETMLPDAAQDSNKHIRFKEGTVRTLDKRNGQARRFRMVHSADVVISLEGEQGTRLVLDVALAIERPILPLPFGGGTSKKAWMNQREDICKWFQIDQDEAAYFDQVNLSALSESEIQKLAVRVHACLMRGFTQGCFVIMHFHDSSDPVFDDAIEPALATFGYHAWRTDRSVPVGDIIEAIREGISHCCFAIADTTGDRPNIMYEMGFAQAIGKDVILLRCNAPDGTSTSAPFDFGTQSILYYDNNREGLIDLRKRLEGAIAFVSGKSVR